MKLSVLDLIPVSSRQSTADALAATRRLAVRADELGFERYWFAEHHNMASVASTSPAVAIALTLAATSRIRVGSGGVMLPNHAPLVVAEQFALLEAAAPGRVDIGLGRAPGSDPVVTAVLTGSGSASGANNFPDHVTDILALLSQDGAGVRLASGQPYALRATPDPGGAPEMWLLGSSDFSAQLAAQFGLPYVFAHHFAGEGAENALRLYRENFRPSEYAAAPKTFVTVNAVVAETAEEAEARALPQLAQMARLRTNEKLGKLPTVEEAAAAPLTSLQEEMIARMRDSWIIGEPGPSAARLRSLASHFGVDEVMISPVAADRDSDDPRDGAARVATIELLNAALSD